MTQAEIPAGVRVKVLHRRRFDGEEEALPRTARELLIPLPKGGVTYVQLLRESGAETETEMLAEGYAFCSDNDNYCKQIGRMIATGRALKAFRERGN